MSDTDKPYIGAETLDDLLRTAGERILEEGQETHPSKGKAKELTGVLLELKSPRARLSRSETRGKLFSALGHLLWYLSRSADTGQIGYYISWYEELDKDEATGSAYGPRLFDWSGVDQVGNVTKRLREHPSSRRAVIQLFSHRDLQRTLDGEDEESPPCTCTLQFLLRGEENDKLHLVTYMRSNDWHLGLPHDLFCFTMLQEIIARDLGVEVGCYKHMVGSLHVYEEDEPIVEKLAGEGWQSTERPMPLMPKDPWVAIEVVLDAEKTLRENGGIDREWLESVDDYWGDLIRLLAVYRGFKKKDLEMIRMHREGLTSEIYHTFVDGKLAELQRG